MGRHWTVISCLIVSQLLISWTNVAQSAVVVCYYGSWATYRSGNGKCDISNLDPNLCTHYIYAFAGLDESTYKIKSLDPNIDATGYTKFVGMKTTNPSLKTLLAVGGWNEGSTKYSNMASTAARRTTFINSVVAFLKQYGFDGLDVDWEYPALNGGAAADVKNYVQLLKELRTEFDKYGYQLTVAVGCGKFTMDNAYDFPSIALYVNYINVMNYDYHGSWETTTGHVAPLYARPDESSDNQLLNVNFTIQYILKTGVPSNKIVMGMPLYGVSYTLSNVNNNGLSASASSPGYPGTYTQQDGFLGYNEICEAAKNGGWTVVRDSIQKVPRAYKGNQWVGYDDAQSVTEKCNFANSLNLAGGMVWSVETDDFRGICGAKNPVLTAIKQTLNSGTTTTTTPAPATTTTAAPTTSTTTAPTTTTTPTTTTKPTTTTTTAAPTTTTTTTKTTTTKATTAAPVPVPGDQAYVLSRCPEGILIRDSKDCSIFYQCVNDGKGGYSIHQSKCTAGLGFDESIQACNWLDQLSGC